MTTPSTTTSLQEVRIPAGPAWLYGDLGLPPAPRGVVLFAHGSGSGRHSARNRQVARSLERAGFATLLFDLLTVEEERIDAHTRQHRFDIALLTRRMETAVAWARTVDATRHLPLGLFGASTGSAAALIAAAQLGRHVVAVVSRGGRPDLAGPAVLAEVSAPTLLIVGGADTAVVGYNEEALAHLRGPGELAIVPGATHLFEEPGALERVAELAAGWFQRHLRAAEHAA